MNRQKIYYEQNELEYEMTFPLSHDLDQTGGVTTFALFNGLKLSAYIYEYINIYSKLISSKLIEVTLYNWN